MDEDPAPPALSFDDLPPLEWDANLPQDDDDEFLDEEGALFLS